jgi:hypothetical protein
MAKQKMVAPKTVAKKDNTNVARKRVNVLVADKPNYSWLYNVPGFGGKQRKTTKEDSTRYEQGFREQVTRDQIAGKSTVPYTAFSSSRNQGRWEAEDRRKSNDLKKGSMVRDSSIPLAPTEFPD